MFDRELAQLGAQDIQHLVDEEYAESQTLEFKSTLPAEGKAIDPWIEGKGKVGEFAKERLLDEIVAFANGYGGWMFLGVKESDDEPKRAAGIEPLPDCADLAVRFRQVCRDLIEPQLPALQVEGIETQADGSGVVGFHVPRSRLAPHRNKKGLRCCVRRADRCEAMTMREVQDMTIQSMSRIQALDDQFQFHRTRGEKWFRQLRMKMGENKPSALLHLCAIPLEALRFGRVHGEKSLRGVGHFDGTDEGGNTIRVDALRPPAEWRPILRGTRGQESRDNSWLVIELGDEGWVDYCYSFRSPIDRQCMYNEWVLGLIWNVLAKVQQMRNYASTPGIEYALEFGLRASRPLEIRDQMFNIHQTAIGHLAAGTHSLVRYSIGPFDELVGAGKLIQRDFWDMAGVEGGPIYSTEFIANNTQAP
jgi:hypothetical protein